MRLPRVHVSGVLAVGAAADIDSAQSHYLKHVLRLKSGAAVLLFDGRHAVDYRARLEFSGMRINAHIEAAVPLHNEPALTSQLVLGLARGDRVDWSIQKATELGVTRIALFNAEFSQNPMKPSQSKKKLSHWQGIACSACAQCGRAVVPEIDFHQSAVEAFAETSGELRLVLDFNAPALTSVLPPTSPSVSILVGPEGGLSPAEALAAPDFGFIPARLGPRVLRSETAAATALAIVQSRLGDL